jgi:hypothetical protein
MENIDKIFKKGLDEARMTPSADVWDKIQGSGVIGEEKKIFWLNAASIRSVAAAVALLLMMFSSYWYFSGSGELKGTMPQIADENNAAEPKDTNREVLAPTDSETAISDTSDDLDTDTFSDPQAPLQHKTLPKHYLESQGTSDRKSIKKKQQLDQPLIAQRRNQASPVDRLPARFAELKNDYMYELPQVAFNQESYDGFRIDLQLSAEDLLYAAEQLQPEDAEVERSLPGKLLDKATNQLNVWADAAGFSIPKLGRISEIEITY